MPNSMDEQTIIKRTSEVIFLFYNRQIDPIAELIDDNFVWIGAYDFQYLVGKKTFLDSITPEASEDPCHVSQEEFHILAYEGNLWTVYGRFTVSVLRKDGVLLLAKVRNTFVWKQVGNKLKLLHIHGSHARDIPLEYDSNLLPDSQKDNWFDYLINVDRKVGSQKKISFRDLYGTYHFIPPTEIMHIASEDKVSRVFTNDGRSFLTRTSLKELLENLSCCFLVHKSHIVNLHYVHSIKRYQLTLDNGEVLPIGKSHYMELKESIGKRDTASR